MPAVINVLLHGRNLLTTFDTPPAIDPKAKYWSAIFVPVRGSRRYIVIRYVRYTAIRFGTEKLMVYYPTVRNVWEFVYSFRHTWHSNGQTPNESKGRACSLVVKWNHFVELNIKSKAAVARHKHGRAITLTVVTELKECLYGKVC